MMERCDFASIIKILRTYVSEDENIDQVEMMYLLFESLLECEENRDYAFDAGMVCRWVNGSARITQKISRYGRQHTEELAKDIEKNIIPLLFDRAMAAEKVYDLVMLDGSISDYQKKIMTREYPENPSLFLAQVLSFGMSREFVKRGVKS